jgi:hypothetical protein
VTDARGGGSVDASEEQRALVFEHLRSFHVLEGVRLALEVGQPERGAISLYPMVEHQGLEVGSDGGDAVGECKEDLRLSRSSRWQMALTIST